MNKKFIAVICAALIISLSFPSVPVLAYNGFQVGTLETLNSIGIDAATYTTRLYRCETSWFESWTSEDYAAYLDLSSMPFDPYNNSSLWICGKGNSTGTMTIWCLDLTGVNTPEWTCCVDHTGYQLAAFYSVDPGVASVPYHIYIYNPTTNSWQNYASGNVNKSTNNMWQFTHNDQSGVDEIDPSGTPVPVYSYNWQSNATFLWGNVDHVYSYGYWNHYNGSDYSNTAVSSIVTNFPLFMYGKQNETKTGYQDFFNHGQVLYWNGDEFEDGAAGDPVETNENHMYFNSCDFGFCEPLNVNSFSNFGGAYFYCDYNVDSWVRDHINDYSIVFSAVATIGSRQYNGTVVSKLDPDMCLTLPFNAVFSNFSNLGFSTYVTNKKIDGNYLKTYLYSVDPNNYLSFYNSVSSGSSGNSLSDAINRLILSDANSTGVLAYTSDNLSQVIKQNILTTEFLNGLYFNNNYKFRVQAYLIDNDGNESGAVARLFDIVKGSSTSVDNQGLTNEDPFEPDDDTGEQLPIIPDNTSTVGYSTSGGFVNNINIPSEYSVTYRDGVNTFIDWFNKDPEVTGIQNSFWGALGVFKGNPANELYSDYFSFLPDGFKSIIFGCAGIGIIGAAATILRKRLMK